MMATYVFAHGLRQRVRLVLSDRYVLVFVQLEGETVHKCVMNWEKSCRIKEDIN
jgi:hypothetical protein